MKIVSHRGFACLIVFVLLLTSLPAGLFRASAAPPAQTAPEPVTSHPRIFLTAEDLPRLRSWANESNPMWRDGLLVVAEQAKTDMDAGTVPDQDGGGRSW